MRTLFDEERRAAESKKEACWGGGELPQQCQILSPSDMGFHNAVRDSQGTWRFFDFEYFGWDDPAKLVSDFILHPGPGMQLTAPLQELFLSAVLPLFGEDPLFRKRLACVYPLYGLKWCCILLNEFLPDSLARREFAAAGERQAVSRQREQLDKARRMIERVRRERRRFDESGKHCP